MLLHRAPAQDPVVTETGFVQDGDLDNEKSLNYDLESVAIGGIDCTSFGVKLSCVLFMTSGVNQAPVNLFITVAYLYFVVAFGLQMAGKPLRMSEINETSTLIITLILVRRQTVAFANCKAISAVFVQPILPTMAIFVNKGGRDQGIGTRILQYGYRLHVLPDSRVPTNGKIIDGATDIDGSMLTGKSMPVLKYVDDLVVAVTIDGYGTNPS
ncbi:unnamed protein product [Clonostachys byssicola]|uniref:P-type ATPase A domain-containing protein n=1 Tax=Clonostachys byssicola TaxID=160290 RepID=A0A9N9Y968_9HYPO|nr:unnamed protein product [Clonostachys byssicola]